MSTVIDITIGLSFVFALVALICTGLQEWLASALNLRGKTLWEGVQSMLLANAKADDAGCQLGLAIRLHPLIQGTVADKFGPIELFRWLAGFRQPTADAGNQKPSYMEAGTFANALADSIGQQWKGGSRRFDDLGTAVAMMPDGELKVLLQKMVQEAQGDPAKVRAAIEAWYDNTMKRVSGWYKRRVQVLLIALGLLVAGGMNIDAIHIATSLATQPALRSSLADRAVEAAKAEEVARAEKAAAASFSASAAMAPEAELQRRRADLQAATKDLQDLNLPIGWSGGRPVTGVFDGFSMVVGWMLTALAASFGAPFWFDLIGRLSPLRASGAKAAAPQQPDAAADLAASKASASPQGAGAMPSPASPTSPPGTAVPFRGALNTFEATGISDGELLQVKKTLGVTGSNALTPIIDQALRDLIKQQQEAQKWPATGELSARWVQALLTGQAGANAAAGSPT